MRSRPPPRWTLPGGAARGRWRPAVGACGPAQARRSASAGRDGGVPQPHKLYVFLNAFHLNDARRQALHARLAREHATALWLYAPGYINADAEPTISTANMTQLTGFYFGLGKSYWAMQMHATDFTHPITEKVDQDLFWGSSRVLAPIFHLEDPEATVLGEVIYGLGRCRPGLGVKAINAGSPAEAWTSIYLATPNVPPQLLRGIARFAGVHLYSEAGDVLYATPDLLSVHTVSGGERTFKLPREVEVVYDLYHNRLVQHDGPQFCVKLPPASTALYFAGDASRLDSLKIPN